MPLLGSSARSAIRRTVRSTLGDTVTVLSPPDEGTGTLGETTYGERFELGTLGARVTPETAAERIEADRLSAPQRYTVRVEAGGALGASTAADLLTAQHALRWERPARLGGPVTMEIMATPVDDHGRGRFLDLACEASP